jgi:hypothetical protein
MLTLNPPRIGWTDRARGLDVPATGVADMDSCNRAFAAPETAPDGGCTVKGGHAVRPGTEMV